jgi:hypothetical protein
MAPVLAPRPPWSPQKRPPGLGPSREVSVGLVATLVVIVAITVTVPPFEAPVLGWLPHDWHGWVKGFLERLATAAALPATLAWLNALRNRQ